MTLATEIAKVQIVDELVQPGDLEPGDVIALPEDDRRIRVVTVRLGHGGFIVRLAPVEGSVPGTEREVTLAVGTQVCRYGRIRAG